MHETMEKVKKLCCLKDQLVCLLETEMAKGLGCVPTEEAGAVVDMVKDLAEAEEKLWKACYYKEIVTAMYEDDGSEERAGYDHYRYSSGRFAPKGHGHRSGYTVPWNRETMPPMVDPDMMGKMRMGYMGDKRSPYGESYDKWSDARRHYTESKDEQSRVEMDRHAKEHVDHMMESIQEMWRDADPETRQKIAKDLKGFASGLQM